MNNDNGPCLIVDDEPDMCWAIERILQRAGCVCQTALNAKDALALAGLQTFRVAFLDAKLPDVDGLDLARRLRASNPRLTIVIVSGYLGAVAPIVAEAQASGLIAAFVSKPFDHDDILRAIGSPHLAHGVPPPVV